MSKLIPFLLLVLGIGAGIGAGLVTQPTGSTGTAPQQTTGESGPAAHEGHAEAGDAEYIKLSNQFIVPVVHGETVTSLVVLSLSLETAGGMTEAVYAKEPKLRDGFLRVLFDHANMGGFDGAFTRAENLEMLRRALRDVARKQIGENLRDVLIVDISRQDA